MRSIIAALAMVLAASVANAQHYKGALTAGTGSLTCGKFAQDYAHNTRIEDIYFNWAQGFMSGVNVMETTVEHHFPNDLSARPPEDLKSEIRSYCGEHPLALYIEAVAYTMSLLPKMEPDAPK
jgi:hypothetical protein